MVRFIQTVTRWSVRHVAISLVVGIVLLVGSAAVTSRIRFDTNFTALLPPGAPAVRQVEFVKEKVGGTADLIVALESLGDVDEDGRLRFARRVAQRLEEEPWIQRADAEYPVDFFLDRRLLLLDVETLEELEEAVQDDVNHAKASATNPLFVNLKEDEPPWSSTQKIIDTNQSGLDSQGLRKDLRSKDNRYAFVRVKPKGTSFDMAEGARTLKRVDAIVQALDPSAAKLRVRYSGPLPVNQDQHRTMTEDLGRASVLALVLVLVLLTAFTRQPGAPIILALPLGLGIASTLAITTLSIGQLNLVSGFLVTALVGVGVDYGIHLFLRYLEVLRETDDRLEAMVDAVGFTFPGCLTSGLTTFAAFIAMSLSDFRGFQEYGQIAATGVALTLMATFFLLPPIAVVLTRHPRASEGWSVPLFKARHAWAILVVGLTFTVFSVPAAFEIRYHNNFKTELRGYSEASEFQAEVVEKALGGSLNPAVVGVKTLEEARTVEGLVHASMDRGDSEFQRVLSLATLVPKDLDARAAIVQRIREELDEVPISRLDADQRHQVKKYIALAEAQPWSLDDIPASIQRLLFAIDRSLMFVLIWPSNRMAEDAEIIRWAKALDALQRDLTATGISAPVLDENRVAARVLGQIRTDGPWAVLYGFIAVLFLLIIDFRNPIRVALVTATLLIGFIWMFGFMYVLGLKVNVFNMAVFPTVLGIGIDNAVHLMHRYDQEGRGSVLKVVFTTGTAALLASLTTGIGFAATLIAHHNGIKSMGELAVVGFLGSLLASTVLFPAVLRALELRTSFGIRTRP